MMISQTYFKANRRKHASALLQQLHWLPVSERIVFEILVLVFKARIWGMLQDTYQTYSIILFIQTILDSLDHMLTNISLHTIGHLLHMVIRPLLTLCPYYGINYP